MSFGPDACHDASWNKFIQVLNVFSIEMLPYINYDIKELVGGSNISGVKWMPTIFFDTNIRSMSRPHYTPNIFYIYKIIFLNDTSPVYWCVVILENVVAHQEMSGNNRPQVIVKNVIYISPLILPSTLHKVPGPCQIIQYHFFREFVGFDTYVK